MLLLTLGYFMSSKPLLLIGIVLFSGVVFFQLVNLPVEIDASNRAKAVLTKLGIVDADGAGAVSIRAERRCVDIRGGDSRSRC